MEKVWGRNLKKFFVDSKEKGRREKFWNEIYQQVVKLFCRNLKGGILEIYIRAKWDENLNIEGERRWDSFEGSFLSEGRNYVVELCSTTNFEGDRCEEKLNSSKLSAVGKIEWIPLEFPFSFFFSLTFFFWYWKLIDVEELSREKSTRKRANFFLNNFRINIPKILKKIREKNPRDPRIETLFD